MKKKIVCILMTCIMITVLVNVICASEDKDDKTIGVEIVGNYSKWNGDLKNLKAPYKIGNGITSIVSRDLKGWKTKFYLKDETVQENDFKGVSLGGNDNKYIDAVDLFIYAGHGVIPNDHGAKDYSFALSPSKGGKYAKQSEMFIGNGNLEWLVTFTCNFLSSKDKDRIGHMARGVHSICGFEDAILLTDDMGEVFIKKLKSGMSVKQAFFETAKETKPRRGVKYEDAINIGAAVAGCPAGGECIMDMANNIINLVDKKKLDVLQQKKMLMIGYGGMGKLHQIPKNIIVKQRININYIRIIFKRGIGMKKRVLVLMGVCFVIMLSSCKGNESDKYNMDKKLDIIELNHIATNAAENCIEKVEIDNDIKKEIKIVEEKQIELYSNNPKEYNEKELNVLLEDCFCDKIKSTDSDVDMDIYLLEKGGSLTYYKNSGGLSYSKTMDGDYDSSEKIVSDNKLIGIAQAFIEKSKLFDLNDLFFEYVRPSMYVEEDEIEKVERYEVRFQKKPPKGIDGYVGSQLGISVEIDCNGKIIGFLSFDREIKKINLLYPSKNIKEIEEDILNDKNVMLDYNSSVDKVEFTKMNYVLYCDSVLDKQKYIVPHYEMIDDKNNVVAVLPAIEDKYIKVK